MSRVCATIAGDVRRESCGSGPEARGNETDLAQSSAGMSGTPGYFQADVTRPEEVAKLASRIEELGDLVAVVNCVGGIPSSRPFFDLTPKERDAGIRLDLYPAFFICQPLGKVQ
jgi:NAD(P)-dependent dehydrogenase (short-subunit alcohol dehydrogenase family)